MQKKKRTSSIEKIQLKNETVKLYLETVMYIKDINCSL